MDENRRGLLLAVSAFTIWGLFPLYWPLFEPAGAGEILANRVLWSLLAMAALVLASRRMGGLRALLADHRLRLLLSVAGVLIGINWLTYIWGVNNGYVVETSLGYYINPLITVMLGVVVLSERLRPLQWTALSTGLLAVLTLSVELGRPPYIALVLAFSFGTYGLVKKKAKVDPIEGITVETLVLAPVALAYLVVITSQGSAESWSQGGWHIALLSTMGVITVLPLLLFAGATNRVSLSTVGLVQYITPTLQFILGVTVFHEAMPVGRWIGFLLVWVALAVLTVDSWRAVRRRQLQPDGAAADHDPAPVPLS